MSQYLNLPLRFFNSDRYLGSEPTVRSSCVSLHVYCVGQENGGRVVGVRLWTDRKCQQVIGITRSEIDMDSELWEWEGDDLILPDYNHKQEQLAEVARRNGSRGGRLPNKFKQPQQGTHEGTHPDNPPKPQQEPSGLAKVKKGKVIKGKVIKPVRIPASGDAEKVYITKLKKKLTGKRLAAFEVFWKCFAYPKGKADAADSWLSIPELTNALVSRICKAAEQVAIERPKLMAEGQTPKYAQGWITARRWEDEAIDVSKPSYSHAPSDPPNWQRLRDEVCDDLEAQGVPGEKLASTRTETRYQSLKSSIRDDINAKTKGTSSNSKLTDAEGSGK